MTKSYDNLSKMNRDEMYRHHKQSQMEFYLTWKETSRCGNLKHHLYHGLVSCQKQVKIMSNRNRQCDPRNGEFNKANAEIK